ncbi:MAG: cupin domain-containing protein [Aliidongia sp.]
MSASSPKARRRVVTGHVAGKSVVLSDTALDPYLFRAVPGFEHTYVWKTAGGGEADPAQVDAALPRSALPPPGGSLVQFVTFPPAARRGQGTGDAQAAVAEYRTRLPGLAETFEHDGSEMHVTHTIDYAFVLDGEVQLELDDGATTALSAGDIVVQQATRHGWRNRSELPATIAFFMLDAGGAP